MKVLSKNSSSLFQKLAKCIEPKCIIQRGFLYDAVKNRKPLPLKLAYASYEGTKSHDVPLSSNSAPPLIIMHGLFGSKGNWNSIGKALHQRTQPQRKIIAVDARNHGESPHAAVHTYEALALDIKELMDTLHIPKAALLGHSMGGRAMMMFALRWPELVESLIVADISPVSNSPNLNSMVKFFSAMQAVDIERHLPLSAARMQADSTLARIIADKGVRAFLLTNLVQKPDGTFSWRLNIRTLSENYHQIATFPKVDNLRYEGPTMFIAGGASDYIQKSDHKKIQQLFPKAEFRTVEGAGHWIHSEKPHDFLNLTLQVLNRRMTQSAAATEKSVI